MDESIEEIIEKLKNPFALAIVGYLGWVGYKYLKTKQVNWIPWKALPAPMPLQLGNALNGGDLATRKYVVGTVEQAMTQNHYSDSSQERVAVIHP